MSFKRVWAVVPAIFLLGLAGCGRNTSRQEAGVTNSPADLPSVRLNYRYEADVPPPESEAAKTSADTRNASIQADFDQNRPREVLFRTIGSPDGNRFAAVYSKAIDNQLEYRLDMYSADGTLLQKVTSDLMAVHFPETIQWAPDSTTVAFVAMLRTESGVEKEESAAETAAPPMTEPTVEPGGESTMTEQSAPEATQTRAPTPEAPVGILTFRTEQIYICNADGGGLKPITQTEGLIYFYYVWSPDGSMLSALAATVREWQFLKNKADVAGEVFVPMGRPRIVEKNGRERRLDDGLTIVPPVWSPDSTKVAVAFDTQIRVYDAVGITPTQAAIPLRNDLLFSAQAYDRQLQAQPGPADVNADANNPTNTAVEQKGPDATLPDPQTLASFNPIVALNWTSEGLLYFQTAYIKRMRNEADSATSFLRWHRLILMPQPTNSANVN